MTTEKERFAGEILDVGKKLAQVREKLKEIEGTYFDLGFNSGGVDELIDANIASFNFDASDVGSFITLVQQLSNFFDNSAVATGDYGATVNAIRFGQQ